MSPNLRAVKALVAERLAAAAEEIFSSVEEKLLLTSDVSPEQQRAALHQRLSLVADEIFMILEVMMTADVSGSSEDVQRRALTTETHRTDRLPLSGSVSSEQKSSHLLDIKDESTETDCDPVHGEPSHLQQPQRAEKGTSTTMETEMPSPGNHDDLRVHSSEAESDNSNKEKRLRSNKRKISQSPDEDCCRTCGRSFLKSGKKIRKQESKISPPNRSQTSGRSCCRVCGKFFRYKRSFVKHVLTHEQTSDLCGACGKHLDPDESLKLHLQSCRDPTEDRPWGAEVSDSDEEWKDSEGSDGDDGDSETDETKEQKSKTKGSDKTKRAKNNDNKDSSHMKFGCKVCGKSFCYRASFLRHVQEDEGDADLSGVCGKRFESEDSLRLHLQTYIRTNDCEVCGKHFESHKQLEMHTRTHTGEKPYICSVCGKAFAQNGNLMGHMRVHTGEKPYVCSVCGQRFSFKEYMTAHMRIHTGEKPFLCSVCGKGFRQRGTLKTHMMIHTGESTHRCSVCDKTFYKSGALKIHMRSHTGEKPYLCNVCGRRFRASGSLTKHLVTHDEDRTHGCSVCGETFQRKEDLRGHVETHEDESTRLMSL